MPLEEALVVVLDRLDVALPLATMPPGPDMVMPDMAVVPVMPDTPVGVGAGLGLVGR